MDIEKLNRITHLIDPDKIKTIDDIILIIGAMELTFTPRSTEEFDKIKHLLQEKPKHSLIG